MEVCSRLSAACPRAPKVDLPFAPLRSCRSRIPRRWYIWQKLFATENSGFPSLDNCRYERRARDISRLNEVQVAKSCWSLELRRFSNFLNQSPPGKSAFSTKDI